MDYIVAVILGIIQGFTEFIPVSSTGHLLIAGEIFADRAEFSGFEFDVLLNIGTLVALKIYFRERLIGIVSSIFKDKDYKLLRNVVISTIPAALVGFFFKDVFSDSLRSTGVVVAMLVVVGIIMIMEERIGRGSKKYENMESKNALIVGLAQVLALIPGTSRSGSTILAGRLTGLSLKSAAEYSFIIAIPIVAGAIVRVLFSSEGMDYLSNNVGIVVVGNIASFISGYFAIRFMLDYLSQKGLKTFGYYRLGLALLVVLVTVLN